MAGPYWLTQLRIVTTVLSLGNAIWVFVEKTVAGSSSVAAVLRNHDARIRLWATTILFFTLGALTLVHLIVSTRDVATDLQPGSVRQRRIMLGFVAGEMLGGGTLLTLLLIFR